MNRRLRLWAFFAAFAFAIPASSCGPDFPFTVFVLPHGPGGNYLAYVQGHIGILQPGYRTRSLVIAFNYLTRHPLTAADQQQAVAVNKQFTDGWQADEAAKQSAPPSGFHTCISTRSALGPIDGYNPTDQLEVSRGTNGDAYEDFPNCLDDAFATAARTLSNLSQTYGANTVFVRDWARAQDAVFSNCGDGKPSPFFGPGRPPAPPPAPHLPDSVPATAPLWLQQDRAYQLAAANFYALDFNRAIASFRAIAADHASPWSIVSRYLIARTLVREATLADTQLTNGRATPAQQAAAKSLLLATLTQAQQELIAMQSDPRMVPMQSAIGNLLDFVNLRLQPQAQAAVLVERLQNPNSSNFGQSLIDLTWLRTNEWDPGKPPPLQGPVSDPTGMIAWITDLNNLDQTPNYYGERSPHTPADVARATADIRHHWQTTHSTVWLVAALMSAQPSDSAAQDLVSAAAAVPPSDPAYVAVTYHRLRLMTRDSATRDQLLAVLPAIRAHENTSTLNQFIALDSASAPTLDAWLATTGRVPASESSYMEQGEDLIPVLTTNACGTKITPGATKLFDADAANAFNRDLPLSLLADSAERPVLPENLRYQVAQAALARAILLDQPAIARRMTPLLVHCRSAWAPVLAAYNASTTPNERTLNGLLALMRFASTEPSVRNGRSTSQRLCYLRQLPPELVVHHRP